MSLTFSEPDVQEHRDKIGAIANKGYPYHNLADHRRYEELVYSLFKQEINEGSWANRFDKIMILQGVRERGRDCALFSGGKVAGLIQCKHSVNQTQKISRPECIREILKFVLHSIVDSTLIPDPSHFTYYFSSSSGLAEPALLLLSNFKNEINLEQNIGELVDKIVAANVSLNGLEYEQVESRMFSILQSIQVDLIQSQDLDLLLSKPSNQNIIQLFFDVKAVAIDPKFLRSLFREELERTNNYKESSTIPIVSLMKAIRHASIYLEHYEKELEGLAHSHIKRPHTDDIFRWIVNPLKSGDGQTDDELPIALVSGKAGVGKSAVMAELFHILDSKGISTLGLKADKIYAKSINELAEKLDLGDHILKVVKTIADVYGKVVVLVDQIDALSASVTINSEYLNTFNVFIRKLIEIEGVRVIVSCRIYDLNYDRELKFYKTQKVFTVDLLEKQQVQDALSRLNVAMSRVSPALIELLRTVHNLNVFSRFYSTDISLMELRTLNDLYNFLWIEKIIKVPQTANVSAEKCKELLFKIAELMTHSQMIVVRSSQFYDQFVFELEYLKSNNIIIENANELQLFHQTFFDYVFAKRFVDSNNKLKRYLIEGDQALHLRSSVRMIVNFLRDRDFKEYIRIYNEILFDDLHPIRRLMGTSFRMHIKLLLISFLASQDEPREEEKNVASKLLATPYYAPHFLDTIDAVSWIKLCIDSGYLDELLRPLPDNKYLNWHRKKKARRYEDNTNLVYQFVVKNVNNSPELVLNFLTNARPFEGKGNVIKRVLYFLKTWNAMACRIFDSLVVDGIHEDHLSYDILEKACLFNIDWSIDHFSIIVNKKIGLWKDYSCSIDFNHNDENVFKALFQSDSERAFQYTLEVIKEISSKTKFRDNEHIIWTDQAFHMFEYRGGHTSDGVDRIMRLFVDQAQQLAKKRSPAFTGFLSSSIESDSETILMVVMHGLTGAPGLYNAEFFQLTSWLRKNNFFSTEGRLQFLWRNLLRLVFEFLSEAEQEHVIQLLLSLKFERELKVFYDGKAKYHFLHQYGQIKYHYLQTLPPATVAANSLLKRTVQELNRKFGNSSDYLRPRTGGGVVGPPMESAAYQRMDLKAWENSFFKYDSSYRGDTWSLKGSKMEHARAFEAEVIKRPQFFFSLIEEIIGNNSIDISYAIHGMQGLKSAKYHAQEFRRLFKKIIGRTNDHSDELYTIWLTDWLIDNKCVDEEILFFLCDKATSALDPQKNKKTTDTLMEGINTVRGAAASRLPYLANNVEQKTLIFSTVEKVAEDPVISVRVALMPKLAILMNLDEHETLRIFLKATATFLPDVYKHTVWSASYLAKKHFMRMKNYFENAIGVEEMHSGIATILGVAWMDDFKGSRQLLDRLLQRSAVARGRMVDLALHFISDEDKRKKAEYLYVRFLSDVEQTVVNEYATSFLELDEEKFLLYLPLLSAYSKSPVASKSPGYFFQYLLKCAKRYPKECLSLVSNFHKYERPNITEYGHYDDEPIKVVVGCYNSQRNGNESDKGLTDQCMKLFDKMLLDERFRKTAEQILIEVET